MGAILVIPPRSEAVASMSRAIRAKNSPPDCFLNALTVLEEIIGCSYYKNAPLFAERFLLLFFLSLEWIASFACFLKYSRNVRSAQPHFISSYFSYILEKTVIDCFFFGDLV